MSSRGLAVRLAGVGAVGAFGALITAPLASAAPAVSTSSTPTVPAPTGTAPSAALTITSASVAPSTSTPIAPNYGFQKVRVGVDLKDGAVVPTGSTLAGATITVTETLPFTPGSAAALTSAQQGRLRALKSAAGLAASANEATGTCTTDATGLCTSYTGNLPVQPSGEILDFPGGVLTAVQTKAPAGLIGPAVLTQTVAPCIAPQGTPVCSPDTTDVVFLQTGTLPVAKNDATNAGFGKPVTIPILNNDNNGGAPILSVTATKAKHGTVTVTPTAITYRPNAGFSGVDSFSYTITTGNGSSTATVTITVDAPAAAPAATTAVALPSATTVELANTGAQSAAGLTWGGVSLVAAGSVVVAAASRRRTLAHRPVSRRH